jgi:hypothetical protein
VAADLRQPSFVFFMLLAAKNLRTRRHSPLLDFSAAVLQ